MSQDAPPPPDYAAANTAAVTADANTLPFRLAISKAAQLGTSWTDPDTGKVYDFTGLGNDAMNQTAIDTAKQLMQAGGDISTDEAKKQLQAQLELLPQFNKLNLEQQQATMDAALEASKKYTANTYDQNLEYMPKFGDLQRSEDAKTFAQNLDLGKQGTYAQADWQKDLLPQLNKVYSQAQTDSLNAANAAGRANNPSAYATRDALGAQIAADLAAGDQMTDAQKRQYQEKVRGAQAARGNILGDSAAFDEALQLTDYGDQLKQQRQQAAENFLNTKDLAPNFATVGAVNPVMPNFGSTQPINPTVPNFAPTTTGMPSLAPTPISASNNPLAMLNPNAASQGQQLAQNTYQTQVGASASQGNPWMQGLGLALSAYGTYAGLAAACWVAREVYGADNPRWLRFRGWMLNRAPAPLRAAYLKHGERLSRLIRNRARLKDAIRREMDFIIACDERGIFA
ncbi:MAG TPA: hypothetical protein VG838_00465 [Opitutaceae bacterium]|nr:hypothetical protein [Opitutaceae bacterium]